jgi:hypothetical protein
MSNTKGWSTIFCNLAFCVWSFCLYFDLHVHTIILVYIFLLAYFKYIQNLCSIDDIRKNNICCVFVDIGSVKENVLDSKAKDRSGQKLYTFFFVIGIDMLLHRLACSIMKYQNILNNVSRVARYVYSWTLVSIS